MKKRFFLILIAAVLACLHIISLSSAEYSNYAAPQLEWISNAFPGLWGRPKSEVLRMMAMFPNYKCTDYEDQIGCITIYNSDRQNNIFLNFFTDDYEEHHDSLWKVSVAADLKDSDEQQNLFNILWLDGLKPFHTPDNNFSFPAAIPLYFRNEETFMAAYLQPSNHDTAPFLLVEYYHGYIR